MRTYVLLGFALLISACSSSPLPENWIVGLTLPPNATGVERTAAKTNDTTLNAAVNGRTEDHLFISFDCKGGWAEVTSHLDSCLSAQGYTVHEVPPRVGGVANATGIPCEREYTRVGSKFKVSLTDLDVRFVENPSVREGYGPRRFYLIVTREV